MARTLDLHFNHDNLSFCNTTTLELVVTFAFQPRRSPRVPAGISGFFRLSQLPQPYLPGSSSVELSSGSSCAETSPRASTIRRSLEGHSLESFPQHGLPLYGCLADIEGNQITTNDSRVIDSDISSSHHGHLGTSSSSPLINLGNHNRLQGGVSSSLFSTSLATLLPLPSYFGSHHFSVHPPGEQNRSFSIHSGLAQSLETPELSPQAYNQSPNSTSRSPSDPRHSPQTPEQDTSASVSRKLVFEEFEEHQLDRFPVSRVLLESRSQQATNITFDSSILDEDPE